MITEYYRGFVGTVEYKADQRAKNERMSRLVEALPISSMPAECVPDLLAYGKAMWTSDGKRVNINDIYLDPPMIDAASHPESVKE